MRGRLNSTMGVWRFGVGMKKGWGERGHSGRDEHKAGRAEVQGSDDAMTGWAKLKGLMGMMRGECEWLVRMGRRQGELGVMVG